MTRNVKIDIHADDYALTVNTSKDMLTCMKEGLLNSISIVPNMSCFDECMQMMYEEIPNMPFLPLISVHVDLVEGIKLSASSEYGKPANDDQSELNTSNNANKVLLEYSWGKLFAYSYILGRKHIIHKWLYDEVKAQIIKVDEAIQKCMSIAEQYGVPYQKQLIRIDSHQHAHMIPIVWKAITSVIEKEGLEIEYIRNSKEPLAPFFKKTKLISSYRPVNIIKNLILNFYSGKVDRYISKNCVANTKTRNISDEMISNCGNNHAASSGQENVINNNQTTTGEVTKSAAKNNKTLHNEHMYMWGLIMSGKMDKDRVAELFDIMVEAAEKKHRSLEILFHPGYMLESEKTDEIPEESIKEFYTSPGRHIEMDALRALHG